MYCVFFINTVSVSHIKSRYSYIKFRCILHIHIFLICVVMHCIVCHLFIQGRTNFFLERQQIPTTTSVERRFRAMNDIEYTQNALEE